MSIDFPAFTKALSTISRSENKEYLERVKSYQTLHEFVDDSCASVRKVFGAKVFKGGHIFTRGIGASATFMLMLWITQVAFKLGGSSERYLRRISKEFPESKWRSGTGILASLRGGGGGKNIVNKILTTIISSLDSDIFPDGTTWKYLDEESPGLLGRLEDLLKPASWRPFEKEFVDKEDGSGVYAIVGLDRQFDRVKIRVGQANDLKERLLSHLSQVEKEFPGGVLPVFYNTRELGKRDLDTGEQSLFHLVPENLRLPEAAHPKTRCKICELS